MSQSLTALKSTRPVVDRIVVASAIKPREWYLQEAAFECQCGASRLLVTLIVTEDTALDAMALWPDATVDRNAMFDWSAPR